MPKSIKGVVTVETKRCSRCEQVKPAGKFYRHPLSADGLHSRCQKCLRQATREDRQANPERWRGYGRVSDLRNRYGLEVETYDKMSADQDGKCAICEAPHVNRRGANNFAVDHDHDSGAIRGLLCHNCNRGLGHFKDSAELLIKAALYLRSQREARIA